MSDARSNHDKVVTPRLSWWALNVRFAAGGLFIWLLLTLLGSWAAGSTTASESQFLLSAQWVPLSYLVLVVAYGSIMNRCAAQRDPEGNKSLDSEML